ncbi:glycosyltransferase family 4 protein [Magnetococcus sp. PR-3]|uniref:glycosyltransferase family 4 protein n=1 Tax=Magnetococcus sp. PR-3 TaxID=3120355 RepID=UPI002FCE6788
MRILTFSTLFPNPEMPHHGIFVGRRLAQLHNHAGSKLHSRVVAPVPWFPSTHPRFGHYARWASVVAQSQWHGIDVTHPRYPLIPKVGMSITPWLMAKALYGQIARLHQQWPFQLIDAHYMYPDGVAAALLGQWLNIPVVITSRGTDLNLIPRYTVPRRWIQWAADQAAGLITVCDALKTPLLELGVAPERVTVLRNGVDLDFFKPPQARQELRQKLDMQQPTVLSVGHLIARKGHELAIEALVDLPELQLIICGEGPMEGVLRTTAQTLGVAQRVRFVGALDQTQLRAYYGAADALILASSREGWANVLLEAMACGTPVVASAVWGTPEVVSCPAAGQLFSPRTAQALVTSLQALLHQLPRREETRSYAEGFSWQTTSTGQLNLFEAILASKHRG